MKISTLAISALIALSLPMQSQTKPKKTKQAQKPKSTKTPKKPGQVTAATDTTAKPINKDPDHYYCPPCGRG